MTGYDNKRLDGRNKKKQYSSAVRIYEYTAAAVPVRTQGNGTPPKGDLGPKEACTGLTFVFLSTAKRLVDLMVEPMSFDRIGSPGNSSTMKARLQEEVRFVEFAQSTRVR